MNDLAFKKQKEFYDVGYTITPGLEKGIPDLKIVDYQKSVSGKKMLNIGGGNSADLYFLASTNDIYSIDGSEIGTKEALQHNIKAQVGDVSLSLPYENEIFDVVILKDILEHIYNPFELLTEAKRILKKDGYIIISVPNHFYLPFRLKILFGGNLIWKSLLHNHKKYFEEWNYMHIRFFTWKGFKKMISKGGLRIDKGFWDFGTWAHYSDPLALENAFKLNNKKIINRRQWINYNVLLPGFKIFNFVIPKKLRSWMVSWAPGLLCAGFYIKAKKDV